MSPQARQVPIEDTFEIAETAALGTTTFSPIEFEQFKMSKMSHLEGKTNAALQAPLSGNGFRRPMRMPYAMNMGMMAPPYRTFSERAQAHHRRPDFLALAKGKARMVELEDKNWEQQFAEIDQAGQREEDAEANTAIEAELDEMDRSVLSETNEFGDFESVWRGIQAETAAARQLLDEHDERLDLEDLPLNDFAWDSFDSQFGEGYRDPQLENYLFEEGNIFSATKDPFNEGVKIMNEGGNLSLAALAFEAAVQQDPQHVEAWAHLGSAQAQNEKETPAIRALEQTLKLDPHNLSALMGLAISYTNEGYATTAYRTLERWLSIKYPQIISPDAVTPGADLGFTDRRDLHEKITSLFIRAAQLSPQGEAMDPDVQVGLGVLFYGVDEHAKAVDCFEAALASTEAGASNHPTQAHLLWNRLGATLANSGRSEEAIAAYERALTLNPNFVRARYNLGVSCINIGCFEEAAQHLLGALSMHRVVEREGIERVKEVIGSGSGSNDAAVVDANEWLRSMSAAGEHAEEDEARARRMVGAGMNQSPNLLETLRRVFGSMGRRDLADQVEVGMDVEAFRGEFDF